MTAPAHVPTPVLGLTDEDTESSVFQALGAASMCWDETPTGVFDSTRAKKIGEELIAHLRYRLLVGMDQPDLRVEIDEKINEPTTCKVWRNGVLVFDGRTYG